MIDAKLNWKITEKGVEGNLRIPKEEIEFAIFIDKAPNEGYGILIDMYFDVHDMQKLADQLNKIDIYDGYILINRKDVSSGDAVFQYLDNEHKLKEVFGEGIIHIGSASSLRDAKIYSEIVILQVRKFLHV